MTMTHSNYRLMARIFAQMLSDLRERGYQEQSTEDVILNGAAAFCDHASSGNPKFDREHFMAVVRGERGLNSRPPRKLPSEVELDKQASRDIAAMRASSNPDDPNDPWRY